MSQPRARPANPCFGSGPTAKRPGWSLAALEGALVGRSHRAKQPKARLASLLERSHALLGLPVDYRIGLVPGSDTGAFEMAMWNLLGARGVDVLAFESFGYGWQSDIETQLRLADRRIMRADYGELPPLEHDGARDLVFTWNGTTSGVKVPDGEWLRAARAGLTLCDATSAVFAMALPWGKLDVVTYSWQKVLGGEAQHGMLILSPHAVERLESWRPPWPLPKLLRLTANGKLIEGIFRGETINTPSMLAVEDALDGLAWAERIGGLDALIRRSAANLERHRGLGRAHALGRLPGAPAGDPLLDLDLPQDRRTCRAGPAGGAPGRVRQEPGRSAGASGGRLRRRGLPGRAARSSPLGRGDGRGERPCGAAALARVGLSGATPGGGPLTCRRF